MRNQHKKRKIFVIGLDCAPPSIVFDKKDEFPCLNSLMDKGTWAKFRSVDPPITIPAWISMVTGKTPGSLGLYGFRHREENSYNKMKFSFSRVSAIASILISRGDLVSIWTHQFFFRKLTPIWLYEFTKRYRSPCH